MGGDEEPEHERARMIHLHEQAAELHKEAADFHELRAAGEHALGQGAKAAAMERRADREREFEQLEHERADTLRREPDD